MSVRGVERLVFAGAALGFLFALVAFAKIFLSDAVATFVAGLGLGALGALAIRALPTHGNGKA